MQHSSNNSHPSAAKVPWNKGKMIGARPCWPSHQPVPIQVHMSH